MTNFTKDMKILMAFKAVRTVSEVFFGTFLIAYIMQIANNNIIPVSVYQIIYAFVIGIMFLILGDFVKRKNKMILFRASIVLNFIYLLIIITFQEKILNYICFLGALYGFAVTLGAFPYNVLVSEKVNKRVMSKFYGYMNAINGTVSVLAPVTLGFFMTIGSFDKTAKLLLIIASIEFIISLFIKSANTSTKPFALINYINILKKTLNNNQGIYS